MRRKHLFFDARQTDCKPPAPLPNKDIKPAADDEGEHAGRHAVSADC